MVVKTLINQRQQGYFWLWLKWNWTDVPAHEEEDEGDDADDADDDSDTNKHCGCSEGGRQDCSEIIQSTSTYLSSILAEIIRKMNVFELEITKKIMI